MRPKLLCVDDEPRILQAMEPHIRRRRYVMRTATSGAEGLEVLRHSGPFAVVLSDLRMPGMDGAQFLAKVREEAPETVRMLLTGHADVSAAIAAVNEGQVFRFLTKPCSAEHLMRSIAAAVEQHRLITAERELLERTLHGAVRMLVDVLSLTNPVAFGRATRIKQLVAQLLDRLEVRERWPVEVASLLSQLGCITLPEKTAERLYFGEALAPKEQAMVERMPKVADRLLANIPRLEPVREILAGQQGAAGAEGPLGARLLRLVTDFDDLVSQGKAPRDALEELRARPGRYAPEHLALLAGISGSTQAQADVQEVPLAKVKVGTVFAEDVRADSGVLLVARGYEVTPSFLARLENFVREFPDRLVRVRLQGEEAELGEEDGA